MERRRGGAVRCGVVRWEGKRRCSTMSEILKGRNVGVNEVLGKELRRRRGKT